MKQTIVGLAEMDAPSHDLLAKRMFGKKGRELLEHVARSLPVPRSRCRVSFAQGREGDCGQVTLTSDGIEVKLSFDAHTFRPGPTLVLNAAKGKKLVPVQSVHITELLKPEAFTRWLKGVCRKVAGPHVSAV